MFQLNEPLPGQERVVTDSDVEADGEAFMAMMKQQQG